MDIRIIVFGMVGVLVFLFIGARFFVPKEKNKSRLEATFAEAAMAYKAKPSQERFEKCLEAANSLPHLRDKGDSSVTQYLESQGITSS